MKKNLLSKLILALAFSCLILSCKNKKPAEMPAASTEPAAATTAPAKSEKPESSSGSLAQTQTASKDEKSTTQEAPKAQETISFPTAKIGELNWDEAKVNPSQFIEKENFSSGAIYNFSNLYFIGFSKDGKISYIENQLLEGRGIDMPIFFIQDLVSDDILVKISGENLDEEMVVKKGAVEYFIEKNAAKIDAELEKHKIERCPLKYEKFPYKGDGNSDDSIDVTVSVRDTGKLQYDFLRIIDYTCTATNGRGNKKIIRKKKDAVLEGAFICGFIKNPFENRLAVVIAEQKYGFEGCDILYSFSGCDISKGF